MKSYVGWAVAEVLVSGGDDSDARALLGRTDPLVRGRARRRLQDEVEAVYTATPDIESGRPLLEAVADRLGVVAVRSGKPFWWPSTIAMALVAITAGALTLFFATRSPTAVTAPRFEKLPEVADAYENGGRPLSLGPVGEELFGERVAAFVVAADRHAQTRTSLTELDLDKAQRALTDEKYRALLGEKAYKALLGLAESARVTLDDGESVWGDAGELNDALAEAGLGYYIDDGTLDREAGTTAFLYTHVVERVQVYDIGGGKSERVLWLRRLDKVNRRKTALASTHSLAKQALIRRDLVDESVFERLMPMLAADAAYPLWPVAPSKPRPPEKDELEARAGAKIRDELALAGVSAEDGSRVAKLLAQRDDHVANLGSKAREGGYNIALPSGYLFDISRYKRLEPVVGKWIFEDIEKLTDTLAKDENRAVYSRVRAAYVESFEFHEVQHRLDYVRADELPPADLVKYLRVGADGGELSRFGKLLVSEYSAHLATIANSKIPFATLTRLSWFAFDEDGWNSTFADTAVAVIESLCRVAGIEHGEFISARSVNRVELARAMLALLALSPAEISAHAKTAWQSAFNAPLITPVLRKR